MRALWKGSITFGLVNIPIKIYSTAESKTIKFRQLCAKCHTPIKIKKFCPNHGELTNEDIVLGYEIEKGKFVVVDEEELKKYIPKKTDEIKIVEFVDRDSIDEILKDKKYYIVPDSGGIEAYFLLQYVLDITNNCLLYLTHTEGENTLQFLHYLEQYSIFYPLKSHLWSPYPQTQQFLSHPFS